jgi:hypothetical protein
MAKDEHYVELMIEAKDALGDMLRATEPGMGSLYHQAYAGLKQQIEEATGERHRGPHPRLPGAEGHDATEPATSHFDDYHVKNREIRRCRRDFTRPQRERFILEQLGDEGLTTGEIAERFSKHHPELGLYPGHIQPIVADMFKNRELRREPTGLSGPNPRWRYFRNATLEGPIADLDRQLQEDA